VSVTEFWALTPRETAQAIEAANWRWQQEFERDVRLAWYVARLQRGKRLPALRGLLNALKPRAPLRGEELTKRQEEFESLKRIVEGAREGREARDRAGKDPRVSGRAR
jgi:hypothetical protein